jgi:lysozyme
VKARKAAAWVSICVGCVAGAEGLRTVAYKDPVGIPTICFGETKGVQIGDTATQEECKAMLGDRVQEFGAAVERCVIVPMSPTRKAGLTSFAYNVGAEAFCRSTLVVRLNAGDPAACDEMRRWTKAKGITLPGLVKRRETERQLCLS